MYAENVDSIKYNMTVKICDRLSFKTLQDSAESFLAGLGYSKCNQYAVEGFTHYFLLNEFADLVEKIPKDRKHVEFKAKLKLFKIFQVDGSQIKVLSKIFDAEGGDDTFCD